jgi:sensor histidine kinase YesM
MHIRIHDNGCGMEEPKVAALMRAMANGAPAGESAAAAAAVAAPGAGGRIGIRNTDKRIKLFFGDGYGLSISSSPGAGTSVEIRVPFDPGAAFAPGAPSPAG